MPKTLYQTLKAQGSAFGHLTHLLTPGEIEGKLATIADPEVPEDRFWAKRALAQNGYLASVIAYYETQGIAFIDYTSERNRAMQALQARREAREKAFDERRRRTGDEEIVARAYELAALEKARRAERMRKGASDAEDGNTAPVGLLMTPERARILEYIVAHVTDSARWYGSRTTVARECRVGEATVQRFTADLERHGVLVRLRTGGLREDGSRATNRYTLMHNVLRDLLGLENKWGSKYDADALSRVSERPRNPYFSGEGYAHCSKSERQRRRLAKRARDKAARLAAAHGKNGHFHGQDGRVVENPAPAPVENPAAARFSKEGTGKTAGQLPIDTVTALIKAKGLIEPAIDSHLEHPPLVENPATAQPQQPRNLPENLHPLVRQAISMLKPAPSASYSTAVDALLHLALTADYSTFDSNYTDRSGKPRIKEKSVTFGPSIVKGVECDPC